MVKRGIFFEMKLPKETVPDLRTMTEEQLNAELEKGYADLEAGRTKPAKQAFEELRKQ